MSLPADSDSPEAAAPAPSGAASAEAIIVAQHALITELQARIAELERQLGLHSDNSGKALSSDGLKKKPARVISLREGSGNKSGGQTGHPDKTLSRPETPNATVDYFPKACAGCGAPLSKTTAHGHAARQVFDLPEPQPPCLSPQT